MLSETKHEIRRSSIFERCFEQHSKRTQLIEKLNECKWKLRFSINLKSLKYY